MKLKWLVSMIYGQTHGAMTDGITTRCRARRRKRTIGKMTLGRKTLSIMTLRKMALSLMTL